MLNYLHACTDPVRCEECWNRVRSVVEHQDETMADLQRLLREAQEELKPYAVGPLGEPFFKTKADAERALEQVEWEYDAAIKRAEAAEALVEDQQDNEAELVNACIWNLKQCPSDHCNDVTRVHDRLLKRREELAGEEGCKCGGVLRHPCGPKCLAPAEAQKEGDDETS